MDTSKAAVIGWISLLGYLGLCGMIYFLRG